MLKIRIIVVDRTKESFLKEGEILYLSRLQRYANIEWIEVKPAKTTKICIPEETLLIEGKNIEKKIPVKDYIISLDRSGKAYTSIQLSEKIDKLKVSFSSITYIIGGHLGLSKSILEKSHEILSLSKLTLTHEISRLLLLEQLYRAFTILNNEKYHK